PHTSIAYLFSIPLSQYRKRDRRVGSLSFSVVQVRRLSTTCEPYHSKINVRTDKSPVLNEIVLNTTTPET
ncbi:hypothetical protein, partial [Synechococcus sp. Cruz CV12-2-Slac-r]|uniref:hypothetical protein n=1 Tax=Synechococcus sp. Cruz CV12-2-Slac-r TaxID=2823748 RepID=UPI0020CDDD6B